MTGSPKPGEGPQWAAQTGDVWAQRWRETDAALSGIVPALNQAILAAAPAGPFTAFDIGCGPGSTTLDLASARPDAMIVACDLSASLTKLAGQRAEPFANVEAVHGDAQAVALDRGPFDLFYSRHGVMFFADPVAAFRAFRSAARADARIVFSCFQGFEANSWASQLAVAAAGEPVAPPQREPGAFAFADPDNVRAILAQAGWAGASGTPVAFDYVAGAGDDAVSDAMSFLCAIGPAARILDSLPPGDRAPAVERIRAVIERHCNGGKVEFAAAAWVWTAQAAASPQA